MPFPAMVAAPDEVQFFSETDQSKRTDGARCEPWGICWTVRRRGCGEAADSDNHLTRNLGALRNEASAPFSFACKNPPYYLILLRGCI
jgi:hypothetical protein